VAWRALSDPALPDVGEEASGGGGMGGVTTAKLPTTPCARVMLEPAMAGAACRSWRMAPLCSACVSRVCTSSAPYRRKLKLKAKSESVYRGQGESLVPLYTRESVSLSLSRSLKAFHHIVASSAGTVGAFKTGFDTVNLHPPTAPYPSVESTANLAST